MTIPELDLDELEDALYKAFEGIQEGNYLSAGVLVGLCFLRVHRFNQSLDERHLPSTTDTGLVPAAKRLLYHFLNRRVNCGYECAWVYPYGWVPEAGCPEHD